MFPLTYDKRTLIDNGLRDRNSFKEITRDIGKAHTTGSREVRKHCAASDKGACGRVTHRCIYRGECKRLNVCGDLKCRRKCSVCAKCNEIRPDFREDICHRLSHPLMSAMAVRMSIGVCCVTVGLTPMLLKK